MPPPSEPPGSPPRGAVVRHGLRFLPLLGLVYSLSAGGSFGPEEIVPQSGPGLTILLVLLMPLLYGLPLGLASGEMASRFPVEGGYYRWIRRVFGDFWGFQTGWSAWMGAFCDGAVYAGFAAAYFEELMKNVLPESMVGVSRFAFIFVVIVFCTWANLRGIHIVGWSSVVFNLFVLSPFLVMGFVGVFHWQNNPFVPFKPPDQGWFPSLGAGMLIAMWCYSGYESLSTAAEEMEDPRRNYLKAILMSIVITVPFYLIPLIVSLATSDWTNIDAGAYTAVAWAIGGAGLGTWVAASGMLGNINLFNAYTLAYSRVPFAMAQDGFMPQVLARTHPKYGTPWVSILTGAIIYAVLTFVFPLDVLLVVEMWLYGLIYTLIYLALWRIRCRPDLDEPVPPGAFRFTVPGGKWGIWLIIGPPMALIMVAMFASGPEYILWGGPALLSGAVLYPFARRMRRRRLSASGRS
jgi:amino acid transporter